MTSNSKALVKEASIGERKEVFAGTRGRLPNTDPRVTALTLDVTNALQIQRAVDEVADLEVLINKGHRNLRPADRSRRDPKHLDVNFLGLTATGLVGSRCAALF